MHTLTSSLNLVFLKKIMAGESCTELDFKQLTMSCANTTHLGTTIQKISSRCLNDLTNLFRGYFTTMKIIKTRDSQISKIKNLIEIPELIATSPFSNDSLHELLVSNGFSLSMDINIDDKTQPSRKGLQSRSDVKSISLDLILKKEGQSKGIRMAWVSNTLLSKSKQLTYVWGHPYWHALDLSSDAVQLKTLAYTDVNWMRNTMFDLSHKAIMSKTIRPMIVEKKTVIRTTYALGTGTIRPILPVTLTSNLASILCGFSAFSKVPVSPCGALTTSEPDFLGYEMSIGMSWIPSTSKDQRIFVKGSHLYALYSSGLLASASEICKDDDLLLGYVAVVPGVIRVK